MFSKDLLIKSEIEEFKKIIASESIYPKSWNGLGGNLRDEHALEW